MNFIFCKKFWPPQLHKDLDQQFSSCRDILDKDTTEIVLYFEFWLLKKATGTISDALFDFELKFPKLYLLKFQVQGLRRQLSSFKRYFGGRNCKLFCLLSIFG